MSQNDPIADMLTIIRNGLSARKESVKCPYSKLKEGILEVLKEEGYIKNFKVLDIDPPKRLLKIYLKYGPNGEEVIRKIAKVSKPGRRIYRKIQELPPVLNGLGIHVLSTPSGIISDRKAREQNVGGEVICEIW
jgi:small subunit ribosomal protein S8